MLSLAVLFSSMLVGFVAAQTSQNLTIPNSVDSGQRNQWCLAQNQACPYLCGGQSFVKDNKCFGADIANYSCVCTNGTSPPDTAKYINTVPNNICYANFVQCRKDTPGSQTCTTCGTLNPTDIPKSVASSTIASSTQSATAAASGAATSNASAQGGVGRKTFEGGALVGLLTALGIIL